MTARLRSPHRQYRALVDEIERECHVHEWRAGDVDLWPIATQDLFLDLSRDARADTAPRPPFVVRAAASLATPALNLWKSRHDLRHRVKRPHRADAVFLGDGVSLDHVDGAWRDRFGEPVMAALEREGHTCFVMQPGDLSRLPWARPTFAANQVAARGAVRATLRKDPAPSLSDHSAVIGILDKAGVDAPSVSQAALARRARIVAAQAAEFERILQAVQPKTAFVTTYYAGLGHAFALACRRRGILCVDLQHCPHDDTHRGYRWSKLPASGYSTLPALFWTWSEDEAANIRRWTDRLDRRWHQAVAGGHSQISGLPASETERLWTAALQSAGDRTLYEREILVALQPIGGKQELWSNLASAMESSPKSWRWWVRHHPASTAAQDSSYARLLSLPLPNVVIGGGAQIPLPVLLGHMDALVSLASGAAAEAAMFGVPAFFLDAEARDTFPGVLTRREAEMIEVGSLVETIARLPGQRARQSTGAPPIEDTLAEISRLASDYSRLTHSRSG